MAGRAGRALSPDRPRLVQRAKLDKAGDRTPLPSGVSIERIEIAGNSALQFAPRATRPGRLLYLHGGGYSLGSAQSHKALVARMAEAFALEAVSLDYRLAPEHVCPAAIEDAADALRRLTTDAHGAVVLAGDSAGGGLALATAIRQRDAGQAIPDALILFSPWVDLTCSSESQTARAHADPMLEPDWLRTGASLYLDDLDASDPRASPLFAELAGLPPTLIQVGSDEILLDDSVRLAEALRAAKVEVKCEIWNGMWHDFQMFAPLVPEADRAIDRCRDWLEPYLDAAQA
ncbi:alpha/beta hydrolase [Marinicauda salina]|nr:alpha/beta hydrolase [Marinicauda salina]